MGDCCPGTVGCDGVCDSGKVTGCDGVQVLNEELYTSRQGEPILTAGPWAELEDTGDAKGLGHAADLDVREGDAEVSAHSGRDGDVRRLRERGL